MKFIYTASYSFPSQVLVLLSLMIVYSFFKVFLKQNNIEIKSIP